MMIFFDRLGFCGQIKSIGLQQCVEVCDAFSIADGFSFSMSNGRCQLLVQPSPIGDKDPFTISQISISSALDG